MADMETIKTVLKYGSDGLLFEYRLTPGFVGVLEGRAQHPLPNPGKRISESLAGPIGGRPLTELARSRRSACVVVSDSTRPVPTWLLLPPILETLAKAGIPRKAITILIATGMHRPSTEEERRKIVGPDTFEALSVVDHDSRSPTGLVEVGFLEGHVPVSVNRLYMEADLKILTGFIEPHMWAGFSGGRKSILPGISSIETLKFMHGPAMISHPACEYGCLDGNPFHEAGLDVMATTGADFIVNVTLNERREITGVFSGDPVAAHLDGCRFLSSFCTCEIEEPLDFIVTTNAGAPLDCNLYQTVKGITGAAAVVKKGGDIVIASRCDEGEGSAEYREVLEMVDSPASFLRRLQAGDFFIPDQWCAQEMYQVITEKNVWIRTDGLSPEEADRYHLRYVTSIEECVDRLLGKHGESARWAIIPDGPMVILKKPDRRHR
jgi:lactate racemase